MKAKLTAPESFDAPVNGAPDLLLIVGEHSGDEHASEILSTLRQERPDLKVACLGGVKLEAAGAQLLYDLTAVSIVGFFEVLKHYKFFKKLFFSAVCPCANFVEYWLFLDALCHFLASAPPPFPVKVS